MNAVIDALSHFGITELEMPATPRRDVAGSSGGEVVIPAGFDYEVADSVEHAVELLGREDAKILAGGHSLIPAMRLRIARPSLLVDLGRLDGLSYVHEDDDAIAIGALTRHHDLAASELLQERCNVLSSTAAEIGDPQVRHRGTIGGSVAHGDPPPTCRRCCWRSKRTSW